MMRYEVSKLDETQGYNGQLSEPHFDDEATLLSARRVVPFHRLADKTSKRMLFVGLMLTIAVIIGVAGGLLYTRLARNATSTSQTIAPATDSAPSNDSVSSSAQDYALEDARDQSTAEAVDKDDQKTIEKPSSPSTSVRKRVSVNPAPVRRVQTEPEEMDGANEREIRRAERRAARRARREAAREAQRSDDLFRIREIFEGPRP